jgi:hypothetical protein
MNDGMLVEEFFVVVYLAGNWKNYFLFVLATTVLVCVDQAGNIATKRD